MVNHNGRGTAPPVFDYVVVGAGSAGCTLAARLTESGKYSVLLLEAGASDNGGPGVREIYHPNYYGAFVLDPDGNNIEAVCHEPA